MTRDARALTNRIVAALATAQVTRKPAADTPAETQTGTPQ